MKKKIKYTNEKIGPVKIVEDDFLPKPEEIVLTKNSRGGKKQSK